MINNQHYYLLWDKQHVLFQLRNKDFFSFTPLLLLWNKPWFIPPEKLNKNNTKNFTPDSKAHSSKSLIVAERWVLVRHEGKLAAVGAAWLYLDPVVDAVYMEGVEACQGLAGLWVERLQADGTCLLLWYYFLLAGTLPLWPWLGSWPLGKASPWCHCCCPCTGAAGKQLLLHALHNLVCCQPR